MKNPELRRNISFNHLTYFLLLLFNVLICVGHEKEKNDENIIFIVNSKNPATEINIADVRDYYFKIKRSWPDGENVRFIDRNKPEIREQFLRKILKKSRSDVDLYWIGQKLYTGNSAPLKELSDQSTIKFVSTFKGAIGYVSARADITSTEVKIIKLENVED